MFYDLNVPYAAGDETSLSRTLNFIHELGYNVVALNHTISGKLPNELVRLLCAHPVYTSNEPRHAQYPHLSRSKTSPKSSRSAVA